MSDSLINTPGQPLRLHDLNLEGLAKLLYDKKIRFTDGKRIGEMFDKDGNSIYVGLHSGQKEVINSPARFKTLAAGRRFGKCQAFGTTVQLADGSLHKIEDLIGKTVEVYAITPENTYVKTSATVHYNAKVKTVKITTKYGTELVRTPNHPLYTSQGWGSVETGELKVGTRIAFPTSNPNVGTKTFNKNHLALLGMFLGDGCLASGNFKYTIDSSRTDAIADFESMLDGSYKTYSYAGRNTIEYSLRQNNSIYSILKAEKLIGTTSYTKFIPNFVFELDKEHIKHFLSYLYFTDGWYSANEVGYCSVSKELAEGVRRLLAKMGIVSAFTTKTLKTGKYAGHVSYTVTILNHSEILKFIDRVGIKHKTPQITVNCNSFNSQITTMPVEFCKEFSSKLREKLSFPEQELLFGRVRSDRAVSKDKLLAYCNMFPEFFKEEKNLIESDFYWDEIESIEYLDEQHTAHLDVPTYDNYVNDAIEHNTKVCVLLALAAVLQPGRKIWIVGPEYVHVEKVFVELYSILVNQLGWVKKNANDGTVARKSKGDYIIQLQNGSVIEGKSAANKDSMAGDALDLIIFDEAALESNLEGVWSLIRPTLTDKKGSAIFISSPRGKNDFYRFYKLGQLGRLQREGTVAITKNSEGDDNDMRDWDSWTMPTYTNPFIPREEYESAKKESLQKGTYVTFKQEYDADFESTSDAAFPEFKAYTTITAEDGSPKRIPYHVQDYNFNPAYGPWVAACDFNIARPASTIYMQVDKNNNVIIFDELFKPGTDAYLQAQFILEKAKTLGVMYHNVIGDVSGSFASPSGINSFNQMESVLGHAPVGRRQGRETGNHLLHRWLATPKLDKYGNLEYDAHNNPVTYPKLFVASHCVRTIHALETAKKRTGKDGSIKEDYAEFITGEEGLLDAIRYALCYLFHEVEPARVIKGR